MKSNSAEPDFAGSSRFRAAIDAWVRWISSATIAGSFSIGAGGLPVGNPAPRRSRRAPRPAPSGRSRPRSRRVCSASRISGSDFPMPARRAARFAGEARAAVTSTNSLPPAVEHGPARGELPHRQPERLHRVGHHLLMADGEVDVVLPIARRGDGEQRGDRPALDDLEVVLDEAPLDVLGAAEVRLDPPAEPLEPHDLRIRQRGLLLQLRRDRPFPRPTSRRGEDARASWSPIVLATTSPFRTL